MRCISTIIFILFAFNTAYAQTSNTVRYRNLVFNEVLTDKNISYEISNNGASKNKHHLLDVYQPAGDTANRRPLIIWIHGGGFKFGKKTSRGIPGWSKSFAQRGYVCAAINYRLTKKKALSQFPALADGCYDAVEDLHQVIAFFKLHDERYNIDTNRIILAGNSAGAITALQASYSSFADLAKKAGRPDADSLSKKYNPLKIAAIINMWGAIFDTSWMQNAKVPIVSIHGSGDRVVSINSKDNLMFGSIPIHRQAEKLAIPNRVKVYEGYGHEIQKHFIPFFAGAPVKKRWLEAGQFAADFLYDIMYPQQ